MNQILNIPRCQLVTITILFLYTSIAYASTGMSLDSSFNVNRDTLNAHSLLNNDLTSTKLFAETEPGRLLIEDNCHAGKGPLAGEPSKQPHRIAGGCGESIAARRNWRSNPKGFFNPLDELSVTYNHLQGPFSIFNNEGIEYFDGSNAMIQLQSSARLWNIFSFYIQPLFLYNQNAGGIEGRDDTTCQLHKGYVKLTVDNIEIEGGKDSLWWGPGYHGALLVSNNARPFEMFKISNPRAVVLPCIFRYLGPFRYTLFLSELDKEAASEHPPDSKLFGARLDFRPHPRLELGLSYLAHFGGDRPGIEGLDMWDYLYIIFSNECRSGDKRDSNKQAAVDAALTLPNISDAVPVADSLKLYAEWGGEDQGIVPDKRAYLLGITFADVFTADGLKLRIEYARLSPESVPGTWYSHPVWTMKHYGRVFGHHAGTDADDLFLELSHILKDKFLYYISFDKERSGISKTHTQEKFQYFLGGKYELIKGAKLSVQYGYEKIDDLGNMQGREQVNHLVGAEITLDF